MQRIEFLTFADWLLEAADFSVEIDDGVVRIERYRRVDPVSGSWSYYLSGWFQRKGLCHVARERVDSGMPYDTERYAEACKLGQSTLNDAWRQLEVVGLAVRRGYPEF